MHHHGQVHIIEGAESDELLLPGHQAELAFLVQVPAVFHVDEFLGRHSHQGNIPGERFLPLQSFEADRCPKHHADLAVMTAGVCRPCVGVGMWVPGHAQGV